MEYPMKVYGLNVLELFLADCLTAVAWLAVIFAIAVGLFSDAFAAAGFVGGMLVTATAATGVVLALASSGIRQNRAALDLGFGLLVLTGLGWLIGGIVRLNVGSMVAGVVLVLFFAVLVFARSQAIKARFKPRFLTQRQFETMIQIADTMIDGDGKEIGNPIEAAIRVDHLLNEVDAPAKQDIKTVLVLVEWILPLMILRPFPFSSLGSNERRRAVEKVVGAKGLFRDVARTLKMLACVGYYGSPEAMAQVGYVPFEQRERFEGTDATPRRHADPF